MSTQPPSPSSSPPLPSVPLTEDQAPADNAQAGRARRSVGAPVGNDTLRADPELSRLIAQLCGERNLTTDAVDTALARAVWSRVTEPGDAVAGLLVEALGALHAIQVLLRPDTARAAERAVRDAIGADARISRRQLAAAVKRWLPRLSRAATATDLTAAVAAGMRLVTPESAEWPPQLDDLGVHAPHALWVRGAPNRLLPPSLAVVGARACTGYGTQATTELTAHACAAGFTVVSGAAYGIDAVAHRTALATEAPTIAVLAGGSDRPYPAAHDQLLARIAAEGAVCSELVPGSAPTRWRFLQRNRIIAALSGAVLVTEAGVRSGTLNTAGHAAELGRPIGAVPGPITSPASSGCHRLVREYGATLVTNGVELLELLGITPERALIDDTSSSADGATRRPSLHVRLLDALPLSGGRTLSEAAVRAGVTREEARDTLAELEVLGYAAQHVSDRTGEASWRLVRRN